MSTTIENISSLSDNLRSRKAHLTDILNLLFHKNETPTEVVKLARIAIRAELSRIEYQLQKLDKR